MSNLVVNLDNSFFYAWHPYQEMTLEGVCAYVDQYANTSVTDLQFCLNSQRSSVDCKSRQTVWDGYDPGKDNNQHFFSGIPDEVLWPGGPNGRQHMRNWVHGCWLLHSGGIDPYAVWLERCRLHGIRCWLSMRMNDVHYVNQPDHCIHDRFWKEHHEFRRDPNNDPYNGHCLDYGRKEVRDYQMAYAREMIARYDMDGFELDWMRNPYYFQPGQEAEGAVLLTEFIAEIRHLLDQRAEELGHEVKLCVRVPASPKTAIGLGFDVSAWAHQGLVDTVIISSFLRHNFDVPVEEWTIMLASTGVTLVGCVMASLMSCGKGLKQTLETTRGAAVSLLDRGCSGISLFNFFDNSPYGCTGEAYRQSDNAKRYHLAQLQLGDWDLLQTLSRRHVVTPDDIFVPGQSITEPLPVEVVADQCAELRIHTGPAPGQKQQARVVLKVEGLPVCSLADSWCVTVNNIACEDIAETVMLTDLTDKKTPAMTFAIHSDTLHSGYNMVRITNGSSAQGWIVWLEIAFSDYDGRYSTNTIETDSLW